MELSTYKTFHAREQADAFTELLTANKIRFEVTEDRESLDSLYGDKILSRQYFVKIGKGDFARVDSIVQADAENGLAQVDRSHYLFEFSDDELFEILAKPDEWSAYDFQLSKSILRERGKEINDSTIQLLKTQRVKESAKPEESPKAWIYAGYVLAVLGGLIGIFMGLALMTTKKTLPDGEKVFAYSPAHRTHGTRIFFLGLVMFAISLVILIATREFD